MPMPTLDPDVYVAVVLADPAHKLPMPDRGGRLFSPGGETVNRYDPFYAALLADGSIQPAPPAESDAAEAPEAGSEPVADVPAAS